MAQGKPSGQWVRWHRNGVKKEEMNFLAGKKHGRLLVWNDAGDLIKEKMYDHGQLLPAQ